MFSYLNHLFLFIYLSCHYAGSKTNGEYFISFVCPCACFSATRKRTVLVSFAFTAKIYYLWLKTESKWYFKLKYKKVYILWQSVSFIYKQSYDSRLHEAVYRERPELWPIIGSSIVTVFEVSERFGSSSLWGKVEQQTIAVLHTTLFSTHCHCNTAIYRCTAHHIIQQTGSL